MPFQSEKQRRYLWANEPEIARDWTDTYGSKIQKANGGRIGFARGSDPRALKQRFIEVIRLMNEAEGDELAALALEARTLKEQMKTLEQIEPYVGQGIQSLQRRVEPQRTSLLSKDLSTRPIIPDDEDYQIFPKGYGREQLFPGISTESILDLEVRKPKPIYRAVKGRMDRKSAERFKEMLERHRPSRAKGGRIGFYRGSDRHAGTGSSSSSSSSRGPGPGGQGARGQATQNPGRSSAPSGPGPGGQGARGQAIQNPGITTTRSRIQDERQEDFRKKQMADLLARQQAEKDYTRQGIMKVGPQLALAGSGIGGGGIKNFLGNWGSSVAGSKLGGGLGGMLFGPLGMLLGSLFGQGVGRRAYKASQTPERETMKQILMPELMQNLGLFDKRIAAQGPTTGGEGVETIDIRDKFDRRGDDFSEIEGQEAKIVKGALIQKRFIERKMKAPEIYGKPTQREKEIYRQLLEMDKEEKVYSLPIIT